MKIEPVRDTPVLPVYQFRLNGQTTSVDDDGEMPLLHVVRERLNMTGTKFGCGAGLCGACTVHVDGVAVRSCQISLDSVEGLDVVTIEGLADGDDLHPVQQAWIDAQVPQCGFCQPGMIMASSAFLKDNPNPTAKDVEEQITNLCRCGTYERIKKAILAAAETTNAAG